MLKPTRVALIAASWPKLELYCPNFNGMQAGLTRLGITHQRFSCRGPARDFQLDIDAIVRFAPDLLVYGLRDMVMQKAWREELRARLPGIPIVLWYGDFRDERTTQIDANCAGTIDAMFVSNNAQEDYYKRKWRMPRVHFLPLGCEPQKTPTFDARFTLPFVFIGGQISGIEFSKRAHTIGKFKGTDDLSVINSFEPPMRAKIMAAMPGIYGTAKIALDISHFTDVAGYTSNRYWIIPAFWGFPLTKRWPGCEDYYPSEVRTYFDTYEEAIALRDYYLAHEDERVAKIAHSRAYVHRHSYDKRFKQMFALL